jgi:hypothetical protein
MWTVVRLSGRGAVVVMTLRTPEEAHGIAIDLNVLSEADLYVVRLAIDTESGQALIG